MNFKNLIAYKKSFILAMEVYELSKSFPKEETYALTDQIRRSSRSVTANLAEAYRKRRYRRHFISKLTDCDAENAETQTWLKFAFACKYLEKKEFDMLIAKSEEVGRLIFYMINNPGKFGEH